MGGAGSGGRRRVVRHRRSSVHPGAVAVAALDLRVLEVVCAHRVVRQDQLARLFPDVPERTLRYRTRRLYDLGLVGRCRPYRERGSATNHHWPTRRGDALVGRDSLRGGERRQRPNPLFIEHAAALSELFVTLSTRGERTGLRLGEFRREGDARESFEHDGRARALAPDVLLILADENERLLGAFVELDLGSMSHTRLKAKAELYASYARAEAWRGHHPFLPALLFLTTTEQRAVRFLRALDTALGGKRSSTTRGMCAAAGALAFDLGGLLDGARLRDLQGREGLGLVEVLDAARLPYEQARQAQQQRAQAGERERERLLNDPEALREHLRHHEPRLRVYFEGLREPGGQAVRLLLGSSLPADVDGRAALTAIARDLDGGLLEPGMSVLPSPGASVKGEVRLLCEHYRATQQKLIETLRVRYWDGPSLRKARRCLRDGDLIAHGVVDRLPAVVEKDVAARAQQTRARAAYLEERERAARRLARPLGRLTHPAEDFYPQLDRQRLKFCRGCEEIVYPATGVPASNEGGPACHYCGERHQLTDYTGQHSVARSEEGWP